MIRPTGRHGDHDGFRRHRTSRVPRGLLPALLVLLLVPVILVLKVSTGTTSSIPCDCETCHIDPHAGGFTGCTACHASPPATGSHQVHFNSSSQDDVRYGDTTVRSTADAYIFGCGNCHPLDQAMHRNGTVNVELYNASAPIESLKAKNPASSAYEPVGKTCSNVYCHSGTAVTSGPVGQPLTINDPPSLYPPGYTLWEGYYIMDSTNSNLAYAPYDVYYDDAYAPTPAWGTSFPVPRTCGECHGFPITTVYPQNQAGVGDSHAWLDVYGYQYGHAWNMSGVGVPCATCHVSSVYHRDRIPQSTTPPLTPPLEATYTDPSNSGANSYHPVDIKNRSIHVNGRPEVAFDNGFLYYNSATSWHLRSLSSATYDPLTKTCGNVGCHFGYAESLLNHTNQLYQQQYPKWGQPYRADWGSAECNICHRY